MPILAPYAPVRSVCLREFEQIRRSVDIFFFNQLIDVLSPIPSTSIARRETKCFSDLYAAHRKSGHRYSGQPLHLPTLNVRTTYRTMRREYNLTGTSGRSESTTLTTCGITSPARESPLYRQCVNQDVRFHPHCVGCVTHQHASNMDRFQTRNRLIAPVRPT